MKHVVWVCLFLLCFTFANAQTPPFASLNLDVVRVQAHRDHPNAEDNEAPDETGTGLIVQTGDEGVRILTARHVVHHADKIQVFFYNERVVPVEATVLPASNSSLDLAMLQAHPPKSVIGTRGVPPVSWTASTNLTPSMHVWTINGSWEPVPNNIIRLDSEGDTRKFEYTATSVGSGYSGAPVFDDAGHLIGIHLAQTPRQDYHVSEAVKATRAFETMVALGYTNLNVLHLATETPAPTPTQPASSPSSGPAVITGSISAKPQLWRCVNNNQLYAVRQDGGRLYISQTNGNIVADLALREKDRHFVGRSTLSTCPNGGQMDLVTVTSSRLDGKLEMKPTQPANANCGGLFGVGRSMIPIAFIPGGP